MSLFAPGLVIIDRLQGLRYPDGIPDPLSNLRNRAIGKGSLVQCVRPYAAAIDTFHFSFEFRYGILAFYILTLQPSAGAVGCGAVPVLIAQSDAQNHTIPHIRRDDHPGSLFGGAIFIIALGSWFAVTVASMTGVSNVDKDYFEAAKTLGASERQMVFRVAIPHAMPNILQGMTQALSTACTAIMVAEMMGVKAGLGWYITWAKSWASYDKMFAALFVICMIFTFVTKALNMVKKYALRWQVGMVK